jgi:hypothetical protein
VTQDSSFDAPPKEVDMRLRLVVAGGLTAIVGSAAIAIAALPQGNLVQNAGGESGPGQTSTSNANAVRFIPNGW